jgi:hypothetical protein
LDTELGKTWHSTTSETLIARPLSGAWAEDGIGLNAAQPFSLECGDESGKTACPILFPRVMTWIMFHRKFLLPPSAPVAKMTPAPFIDRYPWSKS